MSGKLRKLSRILLTAAAIVLFVSSARVVARAEDKVTKATQNSITISWDSPESPSTLTKVYNYYVGIGTDRESARKMVESHKTSLASTAREYTFKNLKAGTKYHIYVTYKYETSPGNMALTDASLVGREARTAPAEVSGITSKWQASTKTTIKWKEQDCDSYECKFMTAKGVTIATESVTLNSADFNGVDPFTVYAVQVRAITKQDGKTYTSKWSAKNYIIRQPSADSYKIVLAGSVAKSGKMTVKWKKINGVTGYNVYMSTSFVNNSLKPFKKVKTVKAGKSGVTLTKFGKSKIKKGRKYYVYVEAYKKVGSKTFYSPIEGVTTFN